MSNSKRKWAIWVYDKETRDRVNVHRAQLALRTGRRVSQADAVRHALDVVERTWAEGEKVAA